MKKQPIHIQCQYAGGEDMQKILLRSFRLYVDHSLAERRSHARS